MKLPFGNDEEECSFIILEFESTSVLILMSLSAFFSFFGFFSFLSFFAFFLAFSSKLKFSSPKSVSSPKFLSKSGQFLIKRLSMSSSFKSCKKIILCF